MYHLPGSLSSVVSATSLLVIPKSVSRPNPAPGQQTYINNSAYCTLYSKVTKAPEAQPYPRMNSTSSSLMNSLSFHPPLPVVPVFPPPHKHEILVSSFFLVPFILNKLPSLLPLQILSNSQGLDQITSCRRLILLSSQTRSPKEREGKTEEIFEEISQLNET